ncbi:MAG: efflux RND transporter periplasmic adaptor subunit [Planctomycetota bacterium]
MSFRLWLASFALLFAVIGIGSGLAFWKYAATQRGLAASAQQPEPVEKIEAAQARTIDYRRTSTVVGTVIALRSVTLRNEIEGTVREVHLEPGAIVEAGTLLVAFDVAVEEAELAAQEAEAALADAMIGRMVRASESRAASAVDVDRARAEGDIARAQVARTRAIIARKTLRAPFRARIGLSDLHPGQYLDAGTVLTTLQGVDDALHVDFSVPQRVAATLAKGDTVELFTTPELPPIPAQVVAVDAIVDAGTRAAMVRARFGGTDRAPAPGAAVQVSVPVGPSKAVVVVPVTALRRGPNGDHVFAIDNDVIEAPRARLRAVESGPMLGDEVIVYAGIAAGEQVAASGAFKLRDGVRVAIRSAESEGESPRH